MTILIVDDQISVINGILAGIPFDELGYDQVLTATSSREALDLMKKNKVSIMLTDIEMPGMNGLELNAIVKAEYPETLRIILTSHAVFSYAKESVRLGCFDYIVQPAPLEDIKAVLKRAADHINVNYNNRRMNEYGKLFNSHRSEFMQSALIKLYSGNAQDLNDSIQILNRSGYHVSSGTECQLFLIDVFAYSEKQPEYPSQKDILTSVDKAIDLFTEKAGTEYLISLNSHRQFSLLLFGSDADDIPVSSRFINAFYNGICLDIGTKNIAVYVSGEFPFIDFSMNLSAVENAAKNNIARESGFFMIEDIIPISDLNAMLPDYINRWAGLLESGQMNLLKKDIFACIDKIAVSGHRYQNLCDLHSQLIQLFFRYLYQNSINLSALFTEEYTYQDCMGSFTGIDELKKAVLFLIEAIDSDRTVITDAGYVDKAKAYITENYNKLLSVKEVAEYVHLNPEYFTRLFKKETGLNIKSYIIDCKIETAKDMLKNTSLPVSLVALELGYSNFSHFTQMFKKAENITPSEFRAMAGNNKTAGPSV